MTRDAEHTPSPQSVVVPVEPTPEMIEAAKAAASFYVQTYEDGQTPVEPVSAITYRAMLAAAPNPSSLAGGGGEMLADLHTIKGWLHGLATAPDLTDTVADGGVSVGDCYQQEAREFASRIGRILAALSPEAPARVGAWPEELTPEMEQVWRSAFISQGHLRRNQAGRLKHPDSCEKAAYRALRKFVSKSALTPRHEAPAEGAREREAIARIMDPKGWETRDRQYDAIKRSTMHDKDRPLAFANADYYTRDSLTKADAIIALRAQPQAPDALRVAIIDIAAERQRQIDVEGWTPEHDDDHDLGELGLAAALYALPYEAEVAGEKLLSQDDFIGLDITLSNACDWNLKPEPDRRRRLVKAGALIVAEIERFDRAQLTADEDDGAADCPICKVRFKADDLCLTDIDLGPCHAECLEGSPRVNLDTGEPLGPDDEPPVPYRYGLDQ